MRGFIQIVQLGRVILGVNNPIIWVFFNWVINPALNYSLRHTCLRFRFPFPRNSRAWRENHFTWYFRGFCVFRGFSAGFPCLDHNETANC